jgi:hypothetical protein
MPRPPSLSPPPWLHLLLTALLTAVGLLGGALVGIALFAALVFGTSLGQIKGPVASIGLTLLAVLFLWVGGILGLRLFFDSFTRYVPARCPTCGGAAYYHDAKHITYRCGACGHVHGSAWSTRDPEGA